MPFNLVSTKFHETNFMTLKQKLEDHVIIIFLTVVVLAFSAGWTASEQARVANKTEKIAELEKRIADQSQQLKDNNAAIEPCQKEINELRSKAKSQEAVIKASQDNLTQSRQAIQSLNDLNHKLNLDLQACASNSNVMSLLREVEKRKNRLNSPSQQHINGIPKSQSSKITSDKLLSINCELSPCSKSYRVAQ